MCQHDEALDLVSVASCGKIGVLASAVEISYGKISFMEVNDSLHFNEYVACERLMLGRCVDLGFSMGRAHSNFYGMKTLFRAHSQIAHA